MQYRNKAATPRETVVRRQLVNVALIDVFSRHIALRRLPISA